MNLGRPRRLGGIAVASAVVVVATAAASMPAADVIGADAAIATPVSNHFAIAAAAVQIPESPTSLTEADKRNARFALASRLTAEKAAAEQKEAAAKALKKTLRKERGKKVSAENDAEDITNTGPIPTAATAQSRKIQTLVKKHFPASQLGNAMAVAACESGHSDAIGATNSDGTTDWGAFQLNDGGTLQGSLRAIGVPFSTKEEAQQKALNTEINVRAAARIYAARGWSPWVCAYKIGVVATLYGDAHGPMYGKFDAMGVPTVDVPTIVVGPGSTRKDEPKRKHPKPKTQKSAPMPSSTPTPSEDVRVQPLPDVTADPAPVPSISPTPTPTESSKAPDDPSGTQEPG